MVIVMAIFRRILILVVDQIGKALDARHALPKDTQSRLGDRELWSFSGREIFASLPDQPASRLLGFRCGWDGRL
jgi:hypothetical protein